MMGTSLPSLFLSTLTVSRPSISGIFQSRITAKKSSPHLCASSARATASAPDSTQQPRMPSSVKSAEALSHTIWSSSTTRTGRPLSSSVSVTSSLTSSSWAVTVNWLPSPSLLVTSMEPFIMRTMFSVMAIPRPVPCILLIRESSARENGSKMWGRNSSDIPIPVSVMINSNCAFCEEREGISLILRLIWPPLGVYLTAFVRRFMRTC